MATNGSSTQKVDYRRSLLVLQFGIYKRIVERKHGIPVPLTDEILSTLNDDDLSAYIDSLRDMAHLPPQ